MTDIRQAAAHIAEDPAVAEAPRTVRHGKGGLARTERKWGLIFAAPAIIGFVVFTSGPMVASFVIGLTNWSIGSTPQFVGLGNYETLLHDDIFWSSLRATGYYAVLSVGGGVVVAFLMALLLNRIRRGRAVFRTLFYLPVLMPPVASAIVWLWIFSPAQGLGNTVLGYLGLPGLQWIYDTSTAVPSVALVTVWGFGNMALVFLAALQGVPRELLEAAEIDGANALQRTLHVTIPQVSPIILFNVVTGLIAGLQAFDLAYVMTQGGPNYATYFYVYYIFQEAFTNGNLGMASALAWVLFLVVLVLTVIVFRSARHWVFYEAENAK